MAIRITVATEDEVVFDRMFRRDNISRGVEIHEVLPGGAIMVLHLSDDGLADVSVPLGIQPPE